MKSAEDWRQALDAYCPVDGFGDDPVAFIRAIQADAIRAAAEKAREEYESGVASCDAVSDRDVVSLLDRYVAETRYRTADTVRLSILSLIPEASK